MPYISATEAPVFTNIPGATFTGLASPSRGSRENAVWHVALKAGTPAKPHRLTREEIFVVVAGRAMASIDGAEFLLGAGDSLVVPAFTDFSIANPFDQTFAAIAVLPVGGRAILEGAEPFIPPWSA
jgi:mannose-6-phosphate isomerase-like protein (cupin superfamily)